ncbi:TlpA family protein disulfide reductase [Chitinophaga pinensis]|nr:TlpA disulfide reductase family protein [Chitinophaga pinensis]
MSKISGHIKSEKRIDSIMFYWDANEDIADWHNWVITVPVKEGYFSVSCILKHVAQFAVGYNLNNVFYLEPGDSLHIEIVENKEWDQLTFSGRGAFKCRVQQAADEINTNMIKSENKAKFVCSGLDDYLITSNYYKDLQRVRLAYLESKKDSISEDVYPLVQASILCPLEHYRLSKLDDFVRKYKQFGLTEKDLLAIYDSTVNKSFINKIAYNKNLAYSLSYLSYVHVTAIPNKVKWEMRKSGASVSSLDFTYHNEYLLSKNSYSGMFRERILTRLFRKYIKYVDLSSSFLKSDIEDYLSETGFKSYKEFVKGLYQKSNSFSKGNLAPNFSLVDNFGKKVTLDDFKGKVVLIDFWFTGCHPCAQLVPTLRQIQQHFNDNPNVVIINVSIDKEKEQWLNSLAKGKYSTGLGVCLYTEGKGNRHQIINDYGVQGYPRLVIIDKSARIVRASPPDSRPLGNGQDEIELINRLLK